MTLEILTAKELLDKGEIDTFEFQDSNMFGNRKVMCFSDTKEGMQFAYAFVHQYLVPKYGKKEAAKFPFLRTGPARNGVDMLDEAVGIKSPSAQNPIWFAIPKNRFSDVEEFLKLYKK